MKPIILLFLYLILFPLSLGMEYYCYPMEELCCELIQTGAAYSYLCLCYPKDYEYFPSYFKKIKQCEANDEAPRCYQNNVWSPELECHCEKK